MFLMCQTPNYENGSNNSCSSIPQVYSENNNIVNTLNVSLAIKNKTSMNKLIVCHFMNVRFLIISVQNEPTVKEDQCLL